MTSLGSMIPMFRNLVPRFSREFFTCRQCLQNQTHIWKDSKKWMSMTRPRACRPSTIVQRIRTQNISSALKSVSFSSGSKSASEGLVGRKAQFPKTSEKIVAYWLLGSAASVFGIVVFGGLTRLTESGLSITEWRPVAGSIPPINEQDWEAEFAKYRSSPEFKLLNPHLTLSEFKSIYYMEWIHRLWGRFVGLSFLLPTVYFIATKKVSKPMALRLGGIAGLIGFQGFLGWWMVKSGLKDDLFAPGSHPRVSQYRLTAHLGAAFICYAAMLWNGLAILRSRRLLTDPQNGFKVLEALRDPKLRIFRRSVAGLALLVFATAMSGGLVAGLDAGLIYNEFPFMGEGFAPPMSELFSDYYSRLADKSDLWWRNALENPSLVQLNHRILGITTFCSTVGLWAYARYSPTMKSLLPRAAKKGVHGVVGFAVMQATLGVTTLLYLVPTHLASAHQAGSLLLLTWVLVLGSRVWHPSRTAKLLRMSLNSTNHYVSNTSAKVASRL